MLSPASSLRVIVADRIYRESTAIESSVTYVLPQPRRWLHDRVSGTREKAYSDTSLRRASMGSSRRDPKVFAAATVGFAYTERADEATAEPPPETTRLRPSNASSIGLARRIR